MTTISNSDDIIDSRDIIDRLAELAEAWTAHANDPTEPELDADELDELRTLTAFADEASEYAEDWIYGAQLIRDSYFQDYARELAEDCCMIPNDVAWPMTCIDWEWAARELRYDYSAVEFDGVTYWTR